MRISNFCFGVLAVLLSVQTCWANSKHVKSMFIEGNQRIEDETIRNMLVMPESGKMTQDDVNASIKSLYDSGFFSDVRLRIVGNILGVKVTENPSVNRIAFEGNEEIEDDLLKSEISLKPRKPLSQARVKESVTMIQKLYRLKGHFAAEVLPKIVKRPQNRVDVVFEIQEGKSTKVAKIFFVGNRKFSESKLESAIHTKESRWYRFFATDDSYDPDRIAYDRELLRTFYLDRGFADFKILSAVAELSPDKSEFFVTFTLDEGERYRVSDITFKSELKDLDSASLAKVISMQQGDWYSKKEVDDAAQKITDHLGRLGYAFTEVAPQITRDPKSHTLSVEFVIGEGPKVFIETITIVGNDRTDDDVIRRELLFYEGDPYNAERLTKSERRIRNLGYFKEVKIKKIPGSYPDRINIILEVEEDGTGDISIAGGFNSGVGLLGNIKFSERNFRGRGQDVDASITWAKRQKEVDLSFTEPYFMGRDLAAGFDLFHVTQNSKFNHTFEQKSAGGAIRIGYELQEDLIQVISYGIREEKISEIEGSRDIVDAIKNKNQSIADLRNLYKTKNAKTSPFILEQEGKTVVSEISHKTQYDRRDTRVNTTQGWLLGFSNAFAGLGGDVRFLKTSIFGSYYYPIADDVVFELSADVSFVRGLGKKVRVADRYSLGGDKMRGFEFSGIGTFDKITEDPLGGLNRYVVSAEISFPVGLPNELGVKGTTFVDAGSVWKTDDIKELVHDKSSLRVSIGAGILWKSPLGPLKISYAIPLKHERFDRKQRFLFGVSTRF